ncbi:MAG: hypothetical protein NTW28_05050 [Candidatus Solibacter sp.]|nr:hypothetical protein [Candidatus Solibacter sp.]
MAGGGKFGDINSGLPINLPAGTLIRSAADNGPIFISDTAYVVKARVPEAGHATFRNTKLCKKQFALKMFSGILGTLW